MIKYILLFMATSALIYAMNGYEKTLYEKIFPLIFQKNIVKIYTKAPYSNVFQNTQKIIIVSDCKNSDLIFGNIKTNMCENKPLFVTTYKNFEKNNNALGAFYWRKGRPQLRFKEEVFKKFHLKLPTILKKYAQ